MRTLTRFAILTGAAALVACASRAPTTVAGADSSHERIAATASAAAPVASAPAVPQVASTASPTTSGASQSPPVTPRSAPAAPQSASTAAQKEQVVTVRGYRRVVINGQERYCRIETPTGSRVKKGEVCLTRAQLQAEQDSSRQLIENLQRWSGLAGAPPLIMGGAVR